MSEQVEMTARSTEDIVNRAESGLTPGLLCSDLVTPFTYVYVSETGTKYIASNCHH